MKTPSYQQTPSGIMLILNLFAEHQLSYVLFKCDHIFAGQNKNLDILFETLIDYHQAAALLQEQGFAVRLSERIEKYKTMYTGLVKGEIYSIHLHREIAWHGMKIMDKAAVFLRKEKVSHLIIIPSLEDSILIHAGHVLFENFKITSKEEKYFSQVATANQKYLFAHAQYHHWEKGLRQVLCKNTSKTTILTTWLKKVSAEPATAAYLAWKAAKIPLRILNPHRHGCLISISGVNGSGKTTLAKKCHEHYQPLARHLGGTADYYYFGWQPDFFLTKIISQLLRKNNQKLFEKVTIAPPKKFDLFQELLFGYLYLEFLYRYWHYVRPHLRRNNVVITDRYFYDLYGQYPYARNSFLLPLLLRLFPRSDYAVVLQADVDTVLRRDKTDRNDRGKTVRTVLPRDYLQTQCENFQSLSSIISAQVFSSTENLNHLVSTIIEKSWRKLL